MQKKHFNAWFGSLLSNVLSILFIYVILLKYSKNLFSKSCFTPYWVGSLAY